MQLISKAGLPTIPADGVSAHWVEQLRVADLSVGTYSIPAGGTDGQDPHTEDEIYVITSGRATLVAGAASLPVQPGSVVYVPAGEIHRFTDVLEDFAALVLFAPAEESRARPANSHAHAHAHGEAGHTEARWDQDFWDDRYQSAEALWSGEPNPQLVAEAAGLTPGTALDVGSGEGADAIWLARRGWQVTALDISEVALARGARAARAIGTQITDRISCLHAELLTWIPDARYDLVSAQFMHLPPEPRAAVVSALATAVAPGGTLLVVGHHPADLANPALARPHGPELFATSDDLAALLEPTQWDIVVSAARDRTATDPQGQPVTVRDAVLRARRAG
jgi:SAM-dependent methyltransferase/mannose-6-phosphate isomerase-like protein (cupin superfamily)